MIIQTEFLFNSIYEKHLYFYEETIQYEVQSLYCNKVDQLDLNMLRCNKCNDVGNFEIKGYYYRTIIINNISIRIRITRIRCKNCKRTHAILFLDFIPYYQLSSINSNRLILAKFINKEYDDLIIERLKKRVSLFEARLRDIAKSVYKDEIEEITIAYSQYRKQSYLQIHRGITIAYSSS